MLSRRSSAGLFAGLFSDLAVIFSGPVLFSGRGAGGYPVIPPGVDGRGWLLWHWPWSQWDEKRDGKWQIQVTFVPSGFKII